VSREQQCKRVSVPFQKLMKVLRPRSSPQNRAERRPAHTARRREMQHSAPRSGHGRVPLRQEGTPRFPRLGAQRR